MKKTNQITPTNITNNTNTTNNTKGVNNMKKTRRFKTRLIAGILSVITVFSVGTMAISSASAFAIPGIAETVLSTTFGYAKDEVMKLAGPELSKMGLSPILNRMMVPPIRISSTRSTRAQKKSKPRSIRFSTR